MSDHPSPAFLSLDDLTPDRAVARRLPLALARRYRALPIAQDAGGTTVVMADPGDREAREGVIAALAQPTSDPHQASRVYLVQGDPELIDGWLAELWPELAVAQDIEIWLREPDRGDQGIVVACQFAEYVASLLEAPLRRVDSTALTAASHTILVTLSCLDHEQLDLLLDDNGDRPPAVLLACRPRWPLRKLLVIARGDQVDDTALAWAALLARASGATTAALMVAPHVSAAHSQSARDGIASLLSNSNAIGRRMQRAAQSLAAMQLDTVLHLRQGAPETVIREELASAPYDLAIAGIAVRGAEAQWRLRPLLGQLLPDLNCPLLLTAGDR